MSHRLRITLLVTLPLVLAAAVFVFWWVSRAAPAALEPIAVMIPAADGGISAEPVVAPPEENLNPTDELQPEDVPVVAPPPVVIGQRNALGLQRIEFNPNIGDVFRLAYAKNSGRMLLAVVEPNGLRSIWQLRFPDLSINRVLAVNDRPGEVFLGLDSRDVAYAHFENPGVLYRSDNGGDNWTEVATGIDGAFWDVADDGHGTLWGAQHAWNSAILYRSVDDGFTWSPWKDFQRLYPQHAKTYRDGDDRLALRHLHSVDYVNGRLLVGVGDVARFTVESADGGETWREVWSEGYTAATALTDGSGILLGPDRLQAHGIARYDFSDGKVREVWSPLPYGYSGYTYSLTEIGGNYFAAFHNETNEVTTFTGKSGIIVSPDGQRWYRFLEFDALSHWARTDIFMTPEDQWNGFISLNGALYRFEVPIGRWYDVHQKFN